MCFACHFSAGIKDLQAMESEEEIRMSQLHEQLLQLQIGHETASSHGVENRHSKKTGMLSPRPLFCRLQEFVEYADWDPRWATGEQIGDPKRMAESMTPDHRSTRWLQWKHTVADDFVKTLTKGYKKKKGFRKTASSHCEGDS